MHPSIFAELGRVLNGPMDFVRRHVIGFGLTVK
jgi:hypothetical protein